MSPETRSNGKASRLRERYLAYKSRGLFTYVGRSVILILVCYAVFVLLVYLTGRYLVDFNRVFETLLENLPDRQVLIVFFISESFLGLVPVDLFVVWTQKFAAPVPFLALLGLLSYAGSILSYWIGRWISVRPKIKRYSEKRLTRYMEFTRRWGGAFIIVAALFPFTPFSMVVIALSLLRYPFRSFLIYALFRLIRFVAQGILFFNLLQIHTWIVG